MHVIVGTYIQVKNTANGSFKGDISGLGALSTYKNRVCAFINFLCIEGARGVEPEGINIRI